VFCGLRCVLVGFLLVIVLESVNYGFWRTSGRLRGTLGLDSWYLGFSSVFWFDPVLLGALFDVFLGLLLVSLCFPLSSCWKIVSCGFWRTSGRLRGTLGVDSWYLGFSSVFWVDPVLFGALFDVFWVSICF